MCGICGRINIDGRPVEGALVERMYSVLKHRGPDDEGKYIAGSVGLGHRRLSIIDIESGHQPMSNEDGTVWIVYNGEIYNFCELKDGLSKRGHRFSTKSDTEVIIHLYEEYGTDLVHYLRGMFAFAIWDDKRKRLFCARDRLGQKPFVYTATKDYFIFASEAKAILENRDVEKRVNLEAIHHYLTYGYVPSPLTIFKGIKKLPPGHILLLEDRKVKTERYWMPEYREKLKLREEEAEEALLELLKEATKIRLISDVPLGAFLSGGIDSSAVVAMMALKSKEPVRTFSIGFSEADFDEREFSKIVAEEFGTDHREFVVEPDAIGVLEKLIWHYNEPYADLSCIPTYYLSKVTSQYVKVALTGDGGDEAFAGYERYVAAKIASYYEKIPYLIREPILKILNLFPESASAKNILRRAKRVASAIQYPSKRRYARWITHFHNEQKETLYSPEMADEVRKIDSLRLTEELFDSAGTDDFLDASLFVDTMSSLSDGLMMKIDIASMANSLEVRSPFLDHKLFEFACSLPSEYKLKGMKTKYILKRTLSGILPKRIAKRGKMGFTVPFGVWFRGRMKDYADHILLSNRTTQRGYFRKDSIKDLLDEHTSGKINHSHRIFSLIMLELWHRVFMD